MTDLNQLNKYPRIPTSHFTPPYLISNCRRIASAKYRNHPNWVIAMELFAVGSTTAHQICIDWDIDPDEMGIKNKKEPDLGRVHRKCNQGNTY